MHRQAGRPAWPVQVRGGPRPTQAWAAGRDFFFLPLLEGPPEDPLAPGPLLLGFSVRPGLSQLLVNSISPWDP